MFRTLPYNPTEDFTFISSTAESPLVLVTHPESEFHTLADVVRIAARALRRCSMAPRASDRSSI